MNTLYAPPSAPSCTSSLRELAEGSMNAARTWTTEPATASRYEAAPLWSELLRFGLHGAALGMVTGLSIVLFNRLAALL
ncbi:hypothetical protein ACFJGW_02110 [Burkholderiaceae bacterium UC74_6]